jgi:hypothetical protein
MIDYIFIKWEKLYFEINIFNTIIKNLKFLKYNLL